MIPASTADKLSLPLARTCEDHEASYAITGEAAAQHYAPYLSSISFTWRTAFAFDQRAERKVAHAAPKAGRLHRLAIAR